MDIKRVNWDNYFLNIANEVSKRSTCLRRRYGAVIVKDNKIISTGYNGSASKEPNCCDTGKCIRKEMNIPHGERYELCVAVHAEMNAIINANPERMKGSTIYIYGVDNETNKIVDSNPCLMCKRVIKNAQIANIVYITKNATIAHVQL